MAENNHNPIQLNRIEKRAIEAAAIAPVIQAVAERLGKAEALAILTKVNETEAYERGVAIRKELGAAGISQLAEEVASWGEGGTMEIEVLEQTPSTFFSMSPAAPM